MPVNVVGNLALMMVTLSCPFCEAQSSSTERQASISDGNDFRTNARSQPENRSLVDSLQQRFLLPNRSHGAEQPGATDVSTCTVPTRLCPLGLVSSLESTLVCLVQRAEQEIASHLGRRAIRYLMRLATTGIHIRNGNIDCLARCVMSLRQTSGRTWDSMCSCVIKQMTTPSLAFEA